VNYKIPGEMEKIKAYAERDADGQNLTKEENHQ
jgi:hypothetical protein